MIIQVVTFNYGKKDKNPIDHVRFYSKDDPQKAVRVTKDQVGYNSNLLVNISRI